MAYVVRGKGSSWEIRVSRATSTGPRSQTLATFSELSEEVLEHAQSRTETKIDRKSLMRAARRVGAPVRLPAAERAARDLLAAINDGELPSPALSRVLCATLQSDGEPPSDAALAAARWAGATYHERGEALVDLLLLGDAIPAREPRGELRFPRLEPVNP